MLCAGKACGAEPKCNAWSFCNLPANEHCGTAAKHVDCYLKTAPSKPSKMDTRVSGSPGAGCRPRYGPPPPPPAPPAPPKPPPNWRFFNLVESQRGAILARHPDFGSGYLKDVKCTNSATSLSCPAGVLPARMSAADASVFANVGANWFAATLSATKVSEAAGGVSVDFEKGGKQYSANDKIYLQGPHQLISEAGEWSLDSATSKLYFWPRDQAAMAAGTAQIVATTTVRVLDFRGESWDNLTMGVDVSGIVLSGSDFDSDFLLFNRTNDMPVRFREGMVRFENASDCSLEDSALLDAGHSAVWLQGYAQNISIRGNKIERPGFCGVYFQGIYPGDTWAISSSSSSGEGYPEGAGPIRTAAAADVNKGHIVTDNFIYDYGRRVGHG